MYGEWVRFTLVHNPGAAFGLHVGTVLAGDFHGAHDRRADHSRPPVHRDAAGDVVRTLSLALVCGGAIGNLIDRIHSTAGVVDFIDIGFGDSRWPTFNIADMAVSLGAFLLAWVLWGEDSRSREPVAVPAPATVSGRTARALVTTQRAT